MTTTGTILRVNDEKGYGFVAADDATEYFFHRSALAGPQFEELAIAQRVTFRATESPKGKRAEDVRWLTE